MAQQQSAAELMESVQEHHRALYAYAYRLCGCPIQAEDLVQETFLTAYKKFEQLRDPRHARAWLFTVLRNGYFKELRKKRPRREADLDLALDSVACPVPEPAPFDAEQLQQALDELSPEHKLVIAMFYFEDKSYREIARDLGIPIGTVMSRLARAKRHLRSLLDEANSETVVPGEIDDTMSAATNR